MKLSYVRKNNLQKDIDRLKSKDITDEEIDKIMEKYTEALEELEEKKPAKKTAAKKAASTVVEAPAEEKPASKGRQYNGKYEVYEVADGKYQYHLKASNGEVLVVSEPYASRDGVMKAIEAVKRNLETGVIRVFADKRGRHKFKLIAKNHRVLVLSANYSTEKSAVRASESFAKFAVKADIFDIEFEDTDVATATLIEITDREVKDGGKYYVEKFAGEFSWDLKASNGQILAQADGFTTKASCLNSIETFKKVVETGTFKCVVDKNNKYFYKLYTESGRVCSIGESYPTKQSAESAANSVVSFYKTEDIVDVDLDKEE